MKKSYRLHGILLAGGKSSRMGSPKHLLPVGEKMMLERTLEVIAPITSSITVISNQPELLPMLEGIKVKTDPSDFLYAGPIAGMAAGLEEHAGWHLVVACDLPNIHTNMIDRLLSEMNDDTIDAIIPTVAGRNQPLLGIYHRRCLPIFKECLRKGQRKVQACLNEVRARYISYDNWIDAEKLFFNMNTPEDYQKIIGKR